MEQGSAFLCPEHFLDAPRVIVRRHLAATHREWCRSTRR
jgi:hypothetical protein